MLKRDLLEILKKVPDDATINIMESSFGGIRSMHLIGNVEALLASDGSIAQVALCPMTEGKIKNAPTGT